MYTEWSIQVESLYQSCRYHISGIRNTFPVFKASFFFACFHLICLNYFHKQLSKKLPTECLANICLTNIKKTNLQCTLYLLRIKIKTISFGGKHYPNFQFVTLKNFGSKIFLSQKSWIFPNFMTPHFRKGGSDAQNVVPIWRPKLPLLVPVGLLCTFWLDQLNIN